VTTLVDDAPGFHDRAGDERHQQDGLAEGVESVPPRTVGPAVVGMGLRLHPAQRASTDPAVRRSSFAPSRGTFRVPARTTAVFVERRAVEPTGAYLE